MPRVAAPLRRFPAAHGGQRLRLFGRRRRDRRQGHPGRIHIDERLLPRNLENQHILFIAQHIFEQAVIGGQARQRKALPQ